jgi:DHA2 family lincomycin resistance protein-like MFS transporter
MNSPVYSLPSGLTVEEAARELVRRHISGAPVVDTHGRLLGVVSLFDIAAFEGGARRPRGAFYSCSHHQLAGGDGNGWGKELERAIRRALKGCLVDHIMTSEVISVAPEDPVPSVARLLLSRHIHRVLVMEEGRILGIISTMDILRDLSGRPALARA